MTQGEIERKIAELETKRLAKEAEDKRQQVAAWVKEKAIVLEEQADKLRKEQE